MNLVDSHCHLNYLENDPHKYCLRAVFERAAQVGVHHCLCISVDLENIPDILRIANTYEHVKATIGVHPCDVYKTPDDTMAKLRSFIVDDQVVAAQVARQVVGAVVRIPHVKVLAAGPRSIARVISDVGLIVDEPRVNRAGVP